MYPRYLTTRNGELRQKRQEYVELLTIFPDKSDKTQDFLEFLQNQSDFIKLWPIEE
jgi:CRISPR-associated protein Cmr6